MTLLAWLVEGTTMLGQILEAYDEIDAMLKAKAGGVTKEDIVVAMKNLLTQVEAKRIHGEFPNG